MAQLLQLRRGAVAAHFDVVVDAGYAGVSVAQFVLRVAGPEYLIVAELPSGERRPVRGVRFQVGGLADPLPEPVAIGGAHLRADLLRVEVGVKQVLEVVEVVLGEVVVGEQVVDQRQPGGVVAVPVPVPVLLGDRRPVQQVGVLPGGPDVVDPEAVVIVPWQEGEVRVGGEVARPAGMPAVVEVVVGRRGEVVVPAAEQQVDTGPAQEGLHIEDFLYRGPEGVGVKASISAWQADTVDHPDEHGQVVVAGGGVVVFVGLQPVGLVVPVTGGVVLPAAVVAVSATAVLQCRAAQAAAVGLVQVAVTVLAETLAEEALVDLLDQRVQPVVGPVDREPGVGVPGGGHTGGGEQPPGQRLAHLRGVVVHRLQVQPGHPDNPVVVVTGIKVHFPRAFRRVFRHLAAVHKREGGAGEQRPAMDRGRHPARVLQIGARQRQPRTVGDDRFLGLQPAGWPAGDLDLAHRPAEQLLLADGGVKVGAHRGPGRRGPALIVGHGHGPSIRGRGVRAVPGDSVEQGVILRPRVQDGVSPPSRLVNPGSQIARTARAQIGHDYRAVSEQRTEMLAIQDPVHVDPPGLLVAVSASTEQRTPRPDTDALPRPGLRRSDARAQLARAAGA